MKELVTGKYHKLDIAHREKVRRKYEKILMLRAMLATYEASGTDPDSPTLSELRSRIRRSEIQLIAMGG